MWLVLGFAGLGLLIGNLVGLTSESIVTPVVGLVFTFVGGSVLAVLHKLTVDDRRIAGRAILAFSVCCLIGVYVGITVAEYQVLTPANQRRAFNKQPSSDAALRAENQSNKYLRSDQINQANSIDAQKQQGVITLEQAYERMYRLALGETSSSEKNR